MLYRLFTTFCRSIIYSDIFDKLFFTNTICDTVYIRFKYDFIISITKILKSNQQLSNGL